MNQTFISENHLSEYRLATTDVVCFSSHSEWLEVTGTDARGFLNRLLTNDISTLTEGKGCYTCLCTNKGKMISDLYCFVSPSSSPRNRESNFYLEIPTSRIEIVKQTLSQYIIFEAVSISHHAFPIINKFGPKSTAAKSWLHKKLWGYDAYVRIGDTQDISLSTISPNVQEILRIESRTPKFGQDMDEATLPQEANLYDALSFTKGCYVGQETIARLEHRGHVNKKLVLVKSRSQEEINLGSKIMSVQGEEVGWVTSCCYSPKYHAPIALGYLKFGAMSQVEFMIEKKCVEKIDLHTK